MARFWKKRWIRWAVVGVLACCLVEGVHTGMAIYRLKQEVNELFAFKKTVQEVCSESRSETLYQCFRRFGQPVISRPLDITETILLQSIGVMMSMKDRNERRCQRNECLANLAELSLDLAGKLLQTPAPSRYSPFLYDHVERLSRAEFFFTFIPRIESILKENPKKRVLASELAFEKRLQEARERYDQLRPRMQSEGAADRWSSGVGPVLSRFLKK